MKHLRSIALFACFTALTASACLSGPQKQTEEINVKPGAVFSIAVESNASTGYTWTISSAPDRRLVRLMGSVYQKSNPNLAGAPGKQIWTFKALSHGKTSIELKYARPWEKDVPAEKLFLYNIKIN